MARSITPVRTIAPHEDITIMYEDYLQQVSSAAHAEFGALVADERLTDLAHHPRRVAEVQHSVHRRVSSISHNLKRDAVKVSCGWILICDAHCAINGIKP